MGDREGPKGRKKKKKRKRLAREHVGTEGQSKGEKERIGNSVVMRGLLIGLAGTRQAESQAVAR